MKFQVSSFLFLEGLKAKEIYERIMKVYENSSPSISTVERWVAEFKKIVIGLCG